MLRDHFRLKERLNSMHMSPEPAFCMYAGNAPSSHSHVVVMRSAPASPFLLNTAIHESKEYAYITALIDSENTAKVAQISIFLPAFPFFYLY